MAALHLEDALCIALIYGRLLFPAASRLSGLGINIFEGVGQIYHVSPQHTIAFNNHT